MIGLHRLWRDRVSQSLPLIVLIAMPTMANARPVFETCPPPPPGLTFGFMVSAAADGGVGGVPGDHHKELVCWTEKSAASGQNKVLHKMRMRRSPRTTTTQSMKASCVPRRGSLERCTTPGFYQ